MVASCFSNFAVNPKLHASADAGAAIMDSINYVKMQIGSAPAEPAPAEPAPAEPALANLPSKRTWSITSYLNIRKLYFFCLNDTWSDATLIGSRNSLS